MTEQNQIVFGIEDFQVMHNLIVATSQRGAIRAEEMATVGALYTKVTNILEQAQAVQQDVQPEQVENQEGEKDA